MIKRKTDLEKKIMERIKKKKIKMRPRLYFVTGSILLGAGLALALITTILFVNFAIFRFKIHAPLTYLRFGKLGLTPFLSNFPIIPVLLSIIGIIGGIILIKKYDISYKKSYIGIIISLLSFVLIFGFFLEKTNFNERIARRNNLSQFIRGKFDGGSWVAGQVITVNKTELIIQTPFGKKIVVKQNKQTLLPTGGDIKKGDRIRAVGIWENNKFVARGILLPKNLRNLRKKVQGMRIQRNIKINK